MPFYSYSYLYLLCIDELSNFLFFVTIFQYSLTWYVRNTRFTRSIHSLNTHPAIAVTQERNDLRVRMLLFIIVVFLPVFHVADPAVPGRLHGLLHCLPRAIGAVFGPEFDCFLRFGAFCDHWIHSIRLLPSHPHPVRTTHLHKHVTCRYALIPIQNKRKQLFFSMFRLVIPIACLSVRVIARLVVTFFSRPEIVRFAHGMLSVE